MTISSRTAAATTPAHRVGGERNTRWRNIGFLIASVALGSALSWAAHETEHPVTAANIFIVTVLLNGTLAGLSQGLVSAVIVSLIYDFFIRYPVYAFGFHVIDDVLPIAALTTTAILSGAISGRLRSRVASTERARARLGNLLDYSRELHLAISLEDILRKLAAAMADPVAFGRCLSLIERQHQFRDPAHWSAAIADLGETVTVTIPGAGTRTSILGYSDEQAVVGLTVMAIERLELLEETATAVAAIRSDRLKSALISSLSHDLKTPLAAIATAASNLDQLGSTLGEAERSQMIATIQQQCARLNEFTTKLMSLGRLEGGLTGEDMDVVDLQDAVDGAITAIRPVWSNRNIVRKIEAEGVFTRASPLLLEQALANLIENALRYGPEGGQVTVTLSREGDLATIAVADEGPGIPLADQAHVFDRFYRGANAGGRPGHGIGLSIVKAFTDAMGGTIQLTSPTTSQGGTELRIVLPALDIILDAEEGDHG